MEQLYLYVTDELLQSYNKPTTPKIVIDNDNTFFFKTLFFTKTLISKVNMEYRAIICMQILCYVIVLQFWFIGLYSNTSCIFMPRWHSISNICRGYGLCIIVSGGNKHEMYLEPEAVFKSFALYNAFFQLPQTTRPPMPLWWLWLVSM